MLQVILGIGVPVLGGLSFLAYQEPAAYAKMFPYLIGVGIAGILSLFVWNVAAMQTIEKLRKHIKPVSMDAYGEDIGRCYVGGWWPISVLGLMGYLLFLRALPDLMK